MPAESPLFFGMHPNAEIDFRTKMCLGCVMRIMRIMCVMCTGIRVRSHETV